MEQEPIQQDNKERSFLILTISITLILWVALGWLAPHCFGFLGASETGQFGDQFGAVNSLFTGFAFIGVIYTLLVQRKEIAAAEKQQAKNAEALKEQATLQAQSTAALETQAKLQAQSALISARTALLNQRTNELARLHTMIHGITLRIVGEDGTIINESLDEAKLRVLREIDVLKKSLETDIENLAVREEQQASDTEQVN